jgi:hypothetical protein
MPVVKKKNKNNNMPSISQDNRSLAEKARAKALFESRKKKEEKEGTDFDTPKYLQEQSARKKERMIRAAAIGATGAGGALGILAAPAPIARLFSPIMPAAHAAAASLAKSVIPKNKQKGKLYEWLIAPEMPASKFKKKTK